MFRVNILPSSSKEAERSQSRSHNPEDCPRRLGEKKLLGPQLPTIGSNQGAVVGFTMYRAGWFFKRNHFFLVWSAARYLNIVLTKNFNCLRHHFKRTYMEGNIASVD